MLQVQVQKFSLHYIKQKSNNNLGANSYGTINIPSVTTAAPYNPYAFGSQQQQPPTVIVLGGCPTCKVRIFTFFF